jgi:hypothetical protein
MFVYKNITRIDGDNNLIVIQKNVSPI